MSEYRLRGIPPALWRKVRDKAGPHLHEVLLGLLRLYSDGQVDPLGPSVASTFAAQGGHARAASLSPEVRVGIAQRAAQTRWAKRKTGPRPEPA